MSDQKQFLGVTLFTGLQSAVKFIVNFTIGKMAAVFLGASGFAILGQFQNISTLFQNLSNGAIQNGVIKYIAGSDEDDFRRRLIRTAFTISLFIGLVAGLTAFFCKDYIDQKFLNNSATLGTFVALGIGCVFFSLCLLMTSIFNGLKDFKSLAYYNILQSLSMLFLFIVLTKSYGLNGAMISVACFSVISFFLGYLLFQKQYKQYFSAFKFSFDKELAKKLSAFSLMALFTILSFSLSQLWVRTHIMNNISIPDAGLWEGLNRISNFYIFFLAMLFSSFILPRYAEAKSKSEVKQQMGFNLKTVIPLGLIMLLAVYLLRKFVVQVVFTEEFLPLTEVMHYHLIGDFLKIIAWIYTNMLVARKQVILFILTDFLYHLSFVLLTYFQGTSLEEVTKAYALSGLFYIFIIFSATAYFLNNRKLEA